MPAQGRLGDKAQISLCAHGCPACPHPATGPAIVGSPDVNANRRPALRVEDVGIHAACCSTNMWKADQGSATVFINGKAAFRVGDPSRHCGGQGKLIEGSPNIFVGDTGGGGGGGGGGGATSGGGGGGSGAVGGGSAGNGRGANEANDRDSTRDSPRWATPPAPPANVPTHPVNVTVRVIGMSGEPVSAKYGGTKSGELRGETKISVPAGPFELSLDDVHFADPIPAKTEKEALAERTFRRDPKKVFVATAAEGTTVELQLERAVARLVEVAGFSGAVILPETLHALAGCFRRVQGSQDRVFFTGHGPDSAARARNVRLYLTGPRDAWAEDSATSLSHADHQAIAGWAGGQSGWSAGAAPSKETLGVVFDLYDRSISTLLGGADVGALRALVNEHLAFPPSAQPPSPPPPPDPLYKYGTDLPPRRGRPEHFPFLRCTMDAQVYPVKLAEQAVGDANDAARSLNALNPHLCKNGQWSLVVHDEINLPDNYASGLRNFIKREHYEIHLAPLEPTPVDAKDENVVDCGQSHPKAPFEGARNRHNETRQVEVVFVDKSDLPEKGHVCGGGSGACTVANCRLYDPRETELEYIEPLLSWIGLEARDANDEPLANVAFTWVLPDGSQLPDTLDGSGRSTRLDVPVGVYDVVFPGFADGEVYLATPLAAEVTAFSVLDINGVMPSAGDEVDFGVTATTERVRIVHVEGEAKHEVAAVTVQPGQQSIVRIPSAPAGTYRAIAGAVVAGSPRYAKTGKELTLAEGPVPTVTPKRKLITVDAGELVELTWSSEHATVVRILRDGIWLSEVDADDGTFAAPLFATGKHSFTLLPLRGKREGAEQTISVGIMEKPQEAELVVRLYGCEQAKLASARFRLSLDGKITEGTTSDGLARAKYDSSQPLREAIAEWGPASGPGMPFRQELALDLDLIDEQERCIARLHNLGYSRDEDLETNLRRFQNAHGLLGERGFTDDGKLPPLTLARLDDYYGGASAGQQIGQQPSNPSPTPVAPRCSFPFPGPTKPAKQLTLEEARGLLAFWHNNGDIQLIDDAIKVIDPFDAACNVVRPDPTKPVFIGATVFGVQIRKALGFKNTPSEPNLRKRWGGLDLRRMVAVVELCRYLRNNWDCTEMHCSSFGTLENHGQGIDINGFEVLVEWVVTKLFVKEDWFDFTVPDPDFDHRKKNWPSGTVPKLSYRLAPKDRIGDVDARPYPPGVRWFDSVFFEDIYKHLQIHWSDAGTPTTIGEHSRIMHPDHPDSAPGLPNGREAHFNHFHVDLPAATLVRQTLTVSPTTIRSGDKVQLKVEQHQTSGQKIDVTKKAVFRFDAATTKMSPTGVPGEFEVNAAGSVDATAEVDGVSAKLRIDVAPKEP